MKLGSQEELWEILERGIPIDDAIIAFPVIFTEACDFRITFLNVSFSDSVIFEYTKISNHVFIKNCSFKKGLSIVESEISRINLSDCVFEDLLKIQQTLIKHYTINNCQFKLGSKTTNLNAEEFLIDGVSDSAHLDFYRCNVNSWKISRIKNDTEIMITTFDQQTGRYTDHEIATLSFHANSQFKGLLLVAGVKITNLLLHGDNGFGRINFKDCIFFFVGISHFTNNGLLSFQQTKTSGGGTLQCISSNLGKCEIYEIDFTTFRNIIIQNANIQEIIPTNVSWCKMVQANINSEYKNFGHLRENYRQLKNVMIRQNDKVQELKYHQLEMDAHLEDLRQKAENWPDRFIIWSNKISNAHGHSWRRALLLLIGISLIVFVTNKLLLGYNHFEEKEIFKNVGLFLESINPIRKFSAIYDENKSGSLAGLAYTIDVAYRIAASYMIFQFISAFRKYVKK